MNVENELTVEEPKSHNTSRSAFNASLIDTIKERDKSALVPLFWESSKSVAIIRHGLDIINAPVDYLNRGQLPVIAFGQPLHALVKLVQWNWKENYREKCFVIMKGPLHIEMAALKTIGDWLNNSGWSSALSEADIASSGAADSFLHTAHVTKTRSAHQVNITIF